ncbi:Major phosphate-irrepressible acid phosphatase [Microbacterium oleivorans]|uniref:acid phosphatase n=1 Tax=Microbacterium oleivorans TaxID=273677 RepID=UPI0009774E4F|nr:phosphatase PAP2 family protein [Microbacterium oleivorans]AZS42961.1 Major phosphate-irrepressible acid phosphatase [Microbacterium oleivorans]
MSVKRQTQRAGTRTGVAIGGLGILVACALTAGPAFAADGFTEAQKTATYSSDATASTGTSSAPSADNWSVQMMDIFDGLRTDRGDGGNPAVMNYNDKLTSEINLTASDAQVQRAIVDQYQDMSVSMGDAFGKKLGAIYAEAIADGELPKLTWLLNKEGGKLGSTSSSNPPKNYFDYKRPYLRLDTTKDLVYRDKEGGDAWGSKSGSFPSGHTSQAYWQGTALAEMLPELAPQILARTAEAGNNRVVMAAHYPLDVISGRMMGQKIIALRLADPEMRELVDEASDELRGVLERGCGDTLENCIAKDVPYLPTDKALAYYEEHLGYGFPATGPKGAKVVVPAGAEELLVSSHPDLTPKQRRQVLALTATDSGNPLDVGEQESWQRMNLAAAMAAKVTVKDDGSVVIGTPGTGPTPEPSPTPVPSPSPDPEPSPAPEPTTAPSPTPEPTSTPAPGELPSTGGAPSAPVANGDDLPAAAEGKIQASVRGDRIFVSGLAAGERYYGFVYSAPTALGGATADAEGAASFALPNDLKAGSHRVAVVDESGELVGWAAVTVGQAAAVDDELASTGGQAAPLWIAGSAGTALLALGVVLVLRRRRSSTV